MMEKSLSIAQKARRSISKKYRDEIWAPFITAVKQYKLICPGDRIAVCISGGKDSMLLAVLIDMLQRFSDFPFSVKFLVMDPGYNEENLSRIKANAQALEIPIHIVQTNIFNVAYKTEKSPCYLCAKMRRGHLYAQAKALGCNKIALGHHFSDVIETTVLAMFYGAQLQAMLPKLHSRNFEGMELIRPLYCVHEESIIAWMRYNSLTFIQCACRFTEQEAETPGISKRQEIKELLRELKKSNPDIEKNIFHSIHAVCIDTFPGYRCKGKEHSFLDRYDSHWQTVDGETGQADP